MGKIKVNNNEITILTEGDNDYICLTDMLKSKDGEFFITDWLRNKNTLDYISVWERLNNSDFNYGEFAIITNGAGRNSFKVSVKDLTEKCNAIGIKSKTGRYGGTYAHKDIAFHFGMWISPEFQLLLVTEYQRLKKDEADRIASGWDYRRFLAKTNYVIHTDAIKEHIIPDLTEDQSKYIYSNEADMLNVALFGLTAKQWKEKNPDHASKGLNMRDLADVHQLIVLSNLENNNAYLIGKGVPQRDRLLDLRKNAISQLKSLRKSSYTTDKIKSPFRLEKGTSFPKKIGNGDKEKN
ncbi:KilA-N domain-containing protein [Mucilaginibacter dorajii]|uniref:KilA-N domain-containing protein n=1 Tax=Mucilaginibacter dorajii TaxID=692994 RepID=A0ABP7P7A7_9SPHI|nr:KilA-N domain-containing protein [Mucilaginibacter dorajii]MCS3736557.1 hypothetical protein [Mucilaginibacter dorajii]